VVATALLLGIVVLSFWPYTCDDSFITYRFALNAAAGHGLAFNPGEVVEGYSNPLWLGLLVVAARLGLDLIITSKVLGVLCLGGILWLAWLVVRRLGGEAGQSGWVWPVLATNTGLVYYTVSGMETPLYALFLTGAVYGALRPTGAGTVAMIACGLGAALTRPEGLGVLLGLLAVAVVTRRELSAPAHKTALVAALAAVVIFGGFLGWRLATFGDWLPNTYYAKPPGAFGTMSLLTPLGSLRDYFAESGAVLWLIMGLAGLALGRLPGQWRGALAAGLVLAVQAALLLHARGDWMALHRFLTPVTPVLVAFGFAGLSRVSRWPAAPLLAVGVIVALSLLRVVEVSASLRGEVYPYSVMAGRPQLEAGRWLAQRFPPSTVLACKRIGGIAYSSQMPLVDVLGLVDRRVARLRHTSPQRGEAEYTLIADEVFSRRPDLILLCPLKRWPEVPPEQPVADLPNHLRDVDTALYRGLSRHGYQFYWRLPQGADGELVIYHRTGWPVP
jgi:hypothetical protein